MRSTPTWRRNCQRQQPRRFLGQTAATVPLPGPPAGLKNLLRAGVVPQSARHRHRQGFERRAIAILLRHPVCPSFGFDLEMPVTGNESISLCHATLLLLCRCGCLYLITIWLPTRPFCFTLPPALAPPHLIPALGSTERIAAHKETSSNGLGKTVLAIDDLSSHATDAPAGHTAYAEACTHVASHILLPEQQPDAHSWS